MTRFSGEEAFPFPRTVVADKLADARFLAACVPDAAVRSATPDAAEWQAKATLGFTTATLDTRLTIVERRPREAVAFELANRAAGAGLNVFTRLTFLDGGPTETRVAWDAELTGRSGLLKLVPSSVLARQIESLLGELWQNVRQHLHAVLGPSVP